MIKMITQAADKARSDVQALIDENRVKLREKYDYLTKPLRQAITNEQDIEKLSTAIDRFKLARPANKSLPIVIQVQHRDIDFNRILVIDQIEQEPALFDIRRTFKKIKIVDIGHGYSMVASDQTVLYWEQSQLCFVDQTGANKKMIPWRRGYIEDLCSCPALDQFFIWTREGAFTIDSFLLTEIKIKQVPRTSLNAHSCCTSARDILLLEINREVELWSITDWLIQQKWETIVGTKEFIRCIRLNPAGSLVAIMVGIRLTNKYRFEVREVASMTIVEKGLDLQEFDVLSNIIVALPNNEWLLAIQSDATTAFIIVDKHCQIRHQVDYEHKVATMALMNNDQVLVIRTKEPNQLRFHYFH
ncbi:unnamed protein product [Didymodactylos carnosus]|uniref:Uncharacterized protein n=1 Tax=Didymodactylos carnosus TaxID=1234261 RepID=A0A813YRF6_9BILA|nr:unnamed protein product [Didymodactylos carnosus]CAF3673404.1 unnamed protein product [Didymodactylos carnosus]